MIVMAIIGILTMVAIPKFGGHQAGQEAVLKEDLHVMRDGHRLLHHGQAEGAAVAR